MREWQERTAATVSEVGRTDVMEIEIEESFNTGQDHGVLHAQVLVRRSGGKLPRRRRLSRWSFEG